MFAKWIKLSKNSFKMMRKKEKGKLKTLKNHYPSDFP